MQNIKFTLRLFAFIMALPLFFSGCSSTSSNSSKTNQEFATQCCKECVEAFSQSPVGVGAAGARCGEFSTAQPLSQKCIDYFKANPKTVADCE